MLATALLVSEIKALPFYFIEEGHILRVEKVLCSAAEIKPRTRRVFGVIFENVKQVVRRIFDFFFIIFAPDGVGVAKLPFGVLKVKYYIKTAREGDCRRVKLG